MLSLAWSDEALDDLDQIADYVGEYDLVAANRLLERIEAYAERLVDFPFMHRRGLLPDTREAIVTPNYKMIYRIAETDVVILSVIHTRRQYP